MFDRVILPTLLVLSSLLVSFGIGYTMYYEYKVRDSLSKAWGNYVPTISEDAFEGAVLSGQAEVLSKINQIK